MNWTLLGLDHGRWGYVEAALAELDRTVGLDFFDRKVFAFDGVDASDVPSFVDGEVQCSPRMGLTHNVGMAWESLGPDEWVFHLELDFLVHEAPLEAMRKMLLSRPNVAQMVLERQPLNPAEMANGGLLGGDNIPTFTSHKRWREQSWLFSFNPCVYHSSIATVAGTESVVTKRLRAEGYTFGFWGAQGDPPRCEHIGVQGGMGSRGWAA